MTVPIFRKIDIEVYKPGKSNLSKNKETIKLSANESALGISSRVKKILNVNLRKLFVELVQMKLFKLFANYF